MSTGLNSERQKCGHCTLRFLVLYEFTAEGATNRSLAAKIGNVSHYAAPFLRYLEMCGLIEARDQL